MDKPETGGPRTTDASQYVDWARLGNAFVELNRNLVKLSRMLDKANRQVDKLVKEMERQRKHD